MPHRDSIHREAAVHIVRVLAEAGHATYLAGGCVRDRLLGRVAKDYDVATAALPDQVGRLLPRSRYVGEAFGVVLVTHGRGASRVDIEVATFRREWGYEDGRRPSEVVFSDAEHDAKRRDFTINGLFEDPLCPDDDGRVIDYVGGRDDLEHRLIRAIGDPDERFGEDHLRLLRAVRFAARFGFEIEPVTAAAIRRHGPKLAHVSRERIGQEVQAMFSPGADADPPQAARLIQLLGLDAPALTEPGGQPVLATLQAVDANADYPVALAAWLIDRHVPAEARLPPVERLEEPARGWRRALCLSNEQHEKMRGVLRLAVEAGTWPQMGVARRKRLLARTDWPQALLLLHAMSAAARPGIDVGRIDLDSRPLVEEGVAPEPFVSGDDLVAIGLEPGPDFKMLLDGAYDAQLEGRVRDRSEALEWLRRRSQRLPG